MLEGISLIVSAAAALIAIAAVLRGRQLSRPRCRLHLGVTALESDRPRFVRRRAKRVIIYGLPKRDRNYFIVPIAIGIENTSSLPVTSVRMSVEIPTDCVADDTQIIECDGTVHSIGSLAVPGRMVSRFPTIAQIVFETDLIRPKEQIIFHELVRIARDHIPAANDDRHQAVLARRLRAAANFYSAFRIQILLSAANCDSQSITGLIAAVPATTEEELTSRADALIAHGWEGWKRARGVAGVIWRWRSRSRAEFAELIFLRQDSLQLKPKFQIDPTILRNARNAVLKFVMPPWGFTGEAFEVRGLMRKQEQAKPDDDV